MKKLFRYIFPICIIFLLYGCYTVPVTNRPTLVLAFPGQDELMGSGKFKTMLAYDVFGPKTENKIKNDKVVNICSNLIEVANVESKIHWNWQIAVVENPEWNASCLPGGKILVFTGLLDDCKSDDEIAAVIGHEMAHALARHKVEEQSLIVLSDIGKVAAYAIVKPKYAGWIYLGEVIWPFAFQWFNRYQETEADHIGLILMAKAGYNPQNAVNLWKRRPGYGTNLAAGWFIDFLMRSGHPNDTERVARLEGLMDEANKFYASAPIKRSHQISTPNTSIVQTTKPSSNISVTVNKTTDISANSLKNISESKDNSEDNTEKDNKIESTSD